MNAPDPAVVRLTQLSHGGGCGCKIAPHMLQDLVADLAPIGVQSLLVGIETADDAAVYRINARQAIVATTDFFTPIVDDPYDFGAIAATNAISDLYAMGATPLFALAIVAMPIAALPVAIMRRILEGGAAICRQAGIPVAGGHSIDTIEPIYGLVAIGMVDPANLKRNSGARAGDRLVLGKPLGIGVYSAAIKKDALSVERYRALLDNATQLNTPGIAFGSMADVHALTDVTGFGLLGHLLEMCRGARLGAAIDSARVPLLSGALELVRDGFVTGASARNLESYGQHVEFAAPVDAALRTLLTDPQTSGGLLAACAPEAVSEVLATFAREGFAHAAVIGEMITGDARVIVR